MNILRISEKINLGQKKLAISSLLLLASASIIFFVGIRSASADAWWGYGYRSTSWVLKHGGTIIYYEIENISGDATEYKAVMYDEEGDYVEKEFGKKGLFDDARDGVYKIVAYRGGTENKLTYKGGKKFASIMVTAHPGENIKLKFNYKKKSVKMSTDYVAPVRKPAARKIETAADPVVEPLPIAESADLSLPDQHAEQFEAYGGLEDPRSDFEKMFFPNDPMGKYLIDDALIIPARPDEEVIIAEEETSFFKRVWAILKDIFKIY